MKKVISQFSYLRSPGLLSFSLLSSPLLLLKALTPLWRGAAAGFKAEMTWPGCWGWTAAPLEGYWVYTGRQGLVCSCTPFPHVREQVDQAPQVPQAPWISPYSDLNSCWDSVLWGTCTDATEFILDKQLSAKKWDRTFRCESQVLMGSIHQQDFNLCGSWFGKTLKSVTSSPHHEYPDPPPLCPSTWSRPLFSVIKPSSGWLVSIY